MAAKVEKEGEQQKTQSSKVEEKDTKPETPTEKVIKSDVLTENKSEEIINMPTENNDNVDDTNTKKNISKEEREVKPNKIPIGGLKLPGFFTKPKLDTSEENNENGVTKKSKDEPTLIKEDQCKSRYNLGRRLLNVITNIVPKKKSQDDVELGHEKTETVVDENPITDEVDKAVINVNEAEEIICSTVNELKKSTSSGELEKYAAAADKQPEEDNFHKATLYDRLHSYKCYLPMIAVIIGLILSIYVIVGCGSEDEIPRAIPLREGRYVSAVTSCGLVEGERVEDGYVFNGIPFALQPIQDLRWRPAQMISNVNDCWNDTLPAHNNTQFCTQMLSNGTIIGQEDCLYLNVITPQVRYENPMPVIVLIDTESLTGPSPNIMKPSVTHAVHNRVLFVSPNFRLGAFGFLALDAISKDSYPRISGNYALSDIIAALKWIQLNIHHFGGDPKSVTLLGHRAGATLVSALVTSNQAEGLYTRAWTSSAAAVFPGKPLPESEEANKEIMQALDCHDIKCLRAASTQQIWAATPDTWLHFPADIPTKAESTSSRHEWLVLDGSILQQHPSESWKQERTGNPILVIGTTAHESHTTKLRERHTNWTSEEVRAYLEASQIGALNLTDEVIQLYNATNYRSLVSIITDIRTICPLLINARLQPTVPFYVVTQGEGEDQLANVDADVQAILGRYKAQTEEQRRFSSSIQQIFFDYVSHGTVSQYDPRRRVLTVGQNVNSQEDYNNCNYWISKDIVPRYARLD